MLSMCHHLQPAFHVFSVRYSSLISSRPKLVAISVTLQCTIYGFSVSPYITDNKHDLLLVYL